MNLSTIPWELILPIVILQFILMIVAFVDLIKVYDTNGPKWLWVIIIFISGIIGSIIYFIVGRRNE
ncbi:MULTISPECIES: PLDc N-terminal domain-containing protein [unclassified Psychrobacillus]|uniref:PLDc N-terminal domain-containing protein n=1 Tax=unclassified Psychrobacillus TaxID=2636677 RepID=UPI001F0E23BF|nr:MULTISPECIES: PLDc N-terminal domain-containing protein [unclassified Psychrobacillus]